MSHSILVSLKHYKDMSRNNNNNECEQHSEREPESLSFKSKRSKNSTKLSWARTSFDSETSFSRFSSRWRFFAKVPLFKTTVTPQVVKLYRTEHLGGPETYSQLPLVMVFGFLAKHPLGKNGHMTYSAICGFFGDNYKLETRAIKIFCLQINSFVDNKLLIENKN